ncbi:MAG: hypothetical protein K2P48_07995, partial [Lachnospiraceae bacterium]|nr:hypothetical protein [Lachnospiraceae bacterium]
QKIFGDFPKEGMSVAVPIRQGKRILAASVLVAVRLAADFPASFLSYLELVFLHIVKKIP